MNVIARTYAARRLDEALRDLDAAETSAVFDVGADPGARRILEWALATPLPAPAGVGRARATGSRRRRLPRRAVAVGAAALAAVALWLAVPDFFGRSEGLAWSAVPQALPAERTRAAEDACTAAVADDPSPVAGADRSRMRPVITDARGSLVLVYLSDRAASPSESTCYVRDGQVVAMGGSLATPQSPPAPPVPANSLRVALGGVYSTPAGSIRGVTGRIGSEVVGVVFDTVARGPVTATVRNGYVAAWWPDAPTSESSESTRTAPEIRGATVTLQDGSTRAVGIDELRG